MRVFSVIKRAAKLIYDCFRVILRVAQCVKVADGEIDGVDPDKVEGAPPRSKTPKKDIKR
jgi:hypothetical protein